MGLELGGRARTPLAQRQGVVGGAVRFWQVCLVPFVILWLGVVWCGVVVENA